MGDRARRAVDEAREAALSVLLNNVDGPCAGLPRTAGWGYPEPYTRDMMISALGMLVSGEDILVDALRRVLEALALNQTRLGHITSLAHDPDDRGASDTTPLFLMALAMYRRFSGEDNFLEGSARRAMRWMEYQSPADRVMVSQQPTSDWRDEQWVWGYGLYVNTLVYTYLRLFGANERAEDIRNMLQRTDPTGSPRQHYVHGALAVKEKPYYALYSYKIYRSERFDLLGNCLAILSGIATRSRSARIISWVEAESEALRKRGELAIDLPPCLLPYIQPSDPDWRPRYMDYGKPGEYHNGGIWPFICGFYVAAAVAAGKHKIAKRRLLALTELVKPSQRGALEYGFNEWFGAQNGEPMGQDWQTWSAAMYIYAADCVEKGSTPFFDAVRSA